MMNHKTRFNTKYFVIGSAIVFLLGACAQPKPPVAPEPQPPVASQVKQEGVVKSGLEVFLSQSHVGDTLKYGLLTNQSCVNRDLVHGVQLIPQVVDLQLILSPEHGLFGAEDGGAKIGDEADPTAGITTKTTYRMKQDEINAMVAGLDVILFDIQDIGVRSYTFIYSMSYIMKAAAANGIKVIILDRPNPINGVHMEGNILEEKWSSGVGRYPIPYRHGMTPGELARLFNSEFGINCELEVVKMEGWTRDMWFEETGLPWVPTSPHVPDATTILPMISTGTYGELHVLSEGVGVTIPFEFSGGPWIKNPHEFAEALQARVGAGILFRPTFVKPYYGRYKGEICGGVQLYVSDREQYKPYLVGLQILAVHQELYPEIDLFQNEHRINMFNKVMGSDQIKKDIQAGKDPLEMEAEWLGELAKFEELRKPYLLYD